MKPYFSLILFFETIAQAEKSLFDLSLQTFKNYETLLVPANEALYQQSKQTFKESCLLRPSGKGKNADLKEAFLKGNGEYLYFLQPGEQLDKEALNIIYSTSEKNKPDMIGFKAQWVNETDTLFDQNPSLTFHFLPPDLETTQLPSSKAYPFLWEMQTVPFMYKRSFLKTNVIHYPVAFEYRADTLFYFEALLKSRFISLIKSVLTLRKEPKLDFSAPKSIILYYEHLEKLLTHTKITPLSKKQLTEEKITTFWRTFVSLPIRQRKNLEALFHTHFQKRKYAQSTLLKWNEKTQRLYAYLQKTHKKPAISIIAPVYNTADYLDEYFESLCAQTLQDFELIFVNDGSTDNSLEKIQKFAAKDNRIRILDKVHEGAAPTRNLGLDNAKGNYVVFLDTDDFFSPHLLMKTYQDAIENDTDLTSFALQRYDVETQSLFGPAYGKQSPGGVFSYETNPEKFFFWITTNIAKLYKRSFLEMHQIRYQNLTCFNDNYFPFVAFCYAKRITVVQDGLYYYRYNRPKNTSSIRHKNLFEMVKAFDKIEETLSHHPLWNKMQPYFFVCRWELLINRLKAHIYHSSCKKYYNHFKQKLLNLSEFELSLFEMRPSLAKDIQIIRQSEYLKTKYFNSYFEGSYLSQQIPCSWKFKLEKFCAFLYLFPSILLDIHHRIFMLKHTPPPLLNKKRKWVTIPIGIYFPLFISVIQFLKKSFFFRFDLFCLYYYYLIFL